MLLGVREQRLDGVAGDPRVGVQEQDEAARGGLDAAVPAGGETEIRLLHEPHVGKPLADELDRAVRRPVVDDDRLVLGDAVQAALEPWERVVRHDDDRNRRVRSRPRVSLSV